MAAHIEYQLVSRIIELQDFHTVQKCRITEDFFYEALTKQVFCFIRDHFSSSATYGSIPSWQIISNRFPSFQYIVSYDAINTLCEQLRLSRMSIQLKTLAEQLYTQAELNPREGLATIREYQALLSSQHEVSNDLMISDAYKELHDEYELVASGQGLLGIPWPWEILNEETQGLQKGQFLVLYGRPKQMKTWVGLCIAAHAYIRAQQRVLVVSMEMKSRDIQRRAASVCAQIDYALLRKGKLNPHDRQRLFSWLEFLKEGERSVRRQDGYQPMFLATSGRGERGVGSIRAKIREYKPTLVVVDGLYRMGDDRSRTRTIDWKNITHIAQDLNETAKEEDIPIIGITQANKMAAKNSPREADVAEIAFADALGQECDMAIRVKREKDPQTHEPEVIMSFPATREFEVDNIVIHGMPGINFGYKRQYVGPDQQAQQGPPNGTNGQSNGHSNGKNGKSKNGVSSSVSLPGGGRVVPLIPNYRPS